MGRETGITWCHHTFNPWHGCEKISPGCKNCYAASTDKRWGGDNWGKDAPRRFMSDAYWRQPLNWAAAARAAGVRRRVFCASMADVFERRDDLVPHRLRLWGLIAATADALDWLLLTKRPENAGALVPWGPFGVTPEQWIAGEHEGMGHAKPWPNVWGGVTTENQEEADRRLVHILGDESRPRTVDFAVTFASYEPALERVTFDGSRGGRNWLDAPGLDWIIVGDESGTGRRPADLEWVRAARDQAAAAGVGFHFKQWCGPDAAGLAGDRVKGKIHLPVLDGVVHSAGPTGSVL